MAFPADSRWRRALQQSVLPFIAVFLIVWSGSNGRGVPGDAPRSLQFMLSIAVPVWALIFGLLYLTDGGESDPCQRDDGAEASRRSRPEGASRGDDSDASGGRASIE